MKFVWGPWNRKHVMRHVSLETAEAVVEHGELEVIPSQDGMTLSGYANHGGTRYVIAFMHNPKEIYILTCYRKRVRKGKS